MAERRAIACTSPVAVRSMSNFALRSPSCSLTSSSLLLHVPPFPSTMSIAPSFIQTWGAAPNPSSSSSSSSSSKFWSSRHWPATNLASLASTSRLRCPQDELQLCGRIGPFSPPYRRLHSSTKRRAKRSPHEVLGVPRSASKQDITSAYHALALRWHPDRNRNDAKAEERFKEISAAYQALARGDITSDNTTSQSTATAWQQGAMSKEEAEELFREVFGRDAFDELIAVSEKAEEIRLRAQKEVQRLYPDAEKIVQAIAFNESGRLIIQTTVFRRDLAREVHEYVLSPKEAVRLSEVGFGMARSASFAARDFTKRVLQEVSPAPHITTNVVHGAFGLFIGGLQVAEGLSDTFLKAAFAESPPCQG
eukprot:CAMPEP_0206533094 /NCGR_PEP_ID=MMETSP0325_2-20121206/4762_1 /ASSEMBLY_ACC=CAM_ASM_000347 /TAXON_ID=2866 /ORGANISM="Crypthecodinium cohnii, Strain Seligo" /LENGTH=364 /DNA_ID=CAMNT_0054029675 /DNA_START=52 /DNA_END=1143 /DNA_ORIENTATION=-